MEKRAVPDGDQRSPTKTLLLRAALQVKYPS